MINHITKLDVSASKQWVIIALLEHEAVLRQYRLLPDNRFNAAKEHMLNQEIDEVKKTRDSVLFQ